ncbi:MULTISPECIES: DUF805 domain-containing protein [unclassified Caballeronia]|uniref:DUF805 domain-containing protein n=1 Tax=unclassified Caballeronia TaxID=2646786 RepID=UPI0020289CCE|nr:MULTISPECIES: DUF805 domain-containing protein [unclassified Caballeronia]
MTHSKPGLLGQLFEHRGRIGRMQYLLTALGLSCFYGASYGLLEAMAEKDGKAIEAVFLIAISIAWTFAAIKRAHDFDASGWWTVLLWVPLANFVWGLALIFRKGTDGPNWFGDEKGQSESSKTEPTWSASNVETRLTQPITLVPVPRKKFWSVVGVIGAAAAALLFKVFAFGVGSAAGSAAVHAYDHSQREEKIQTSLVELMNQMNKNTPVMVDKVTRLDNVNGMGRQLTYSYTLVGYKASDLDINALRKVMLPRASNFVCKGDTMKVFVENDIPVTYLYRDEYGVEIMRLRFGKSDCAQFTTASTN